MFAFTRALFERRIPQVVAIYIGASWGLVQFVDFLQVRNGWSPAWTDVTLVGLALLIPSVILFGWNHGRPGGDEWQPAERLGIPLNLVIAVVVLFVAFDNADLSAVVTRVTTRDEAGQTVEGTVPNANYRKRLALFNFDVQTPDTSLTWLQYGLPLGVASDLTQNMFIDVRPSAYFREKLRQLGYRNELNLPLSLKRKIAEEAHLPYFTDADVSRAENGIRVALALYETSTGKLVQRREFANANALALIDEITASLKTDLDIPESAAARDLPVSEVLTASLPAFRQFIDGVVALHIRDDWAAATQLVQNAVELDTTFAFGYASLHNLLLLGNQSEASLAPLQKAMDHLYRLPERLQYDVKAEYYMMKQDKDKAFAVANMKVELFPEDIASWLLLAQFQLLRDDKAGIIDSYKKILELDPSQQERLREIGKLYEAQGDFDSALSNYSQYAERFPSNHDAFIPLARLLRLRGDRADARANYEKVLILAPGNVEATIGLGTLERDAGNFAGALDLFESALAESKTPTDRARALEALANHYELRGQLRQSVRYTEQLIDESTRFQPELMVALMKLSSIRGYMQAGQQSTAQRVLREVGSRLQPPFDGFLALGEVELQIETKQWALADAAVNKLEQAMNAQGFQVLANQVAYGKARIAEGRGDCEAAIPLYERKLALEPVAVDVHVAIGRCYLALKQPQKAIEQIERTLGTLPQHPRGNYELGLAYLAVRNRAKAQEHLRRAAEAWNDADPGFEWVTNARAKLKEVEGMQ